MNNICRKYIVVLCLLYVFLAVFNSVFADVGQGSPLESSSKFIPTDTSIGTWDPIARIYILSTDVDGTIQIDEDNLTLNGAGHTVTGAGSDCGIYLYKRTAVTVRGVNVEGFSFGIYLHDSNNNTLENNTLNRNNRYGIYLHNSSDNTVIGNITMDNHEGIFLHDSSSNILMTNVASSNYTGIYLYNDCNSNILTDNTASKNSHGIYLYNSRKNTLTANTANSNDYYGIYLYDCNNNYLIDNTASWNHSHGFYLNNSSENILTGNTASNNYPGFYFYNNCNKNILTGNTSSDNYYGIYLYYNCNNNEIYQNNFINNKTQAYTHSSSGNVFNFSAPVGGNYWSNWTVPNADGDAFVDSPYVFDSGQDDLPWVRENAWANQPPSADAGTDTIAHPRDVVTLDGSGSSDPEEDYPLTYLWQFKTKPQGSTAQLSGANTVSPSFTVDLLGDYIIELVVTDSLGAQSTADQVLVGTYNAAPIANAGADQSVHPIYIVTLNGSGSSDPEEDYPLTYLWQFKTKPQSSTAQLSGADTVSPSFTVDVLGDYIIELVVTDSLGAQSTADEVLIGTYNAAPVANAGADQSVFVGNTVALNGSASTDGNGDQLTYNWNFTSKPAQSLAELSNPTSVQTSFTVDEAGEYILSLVVNDGFVDSNADSVTVTAITYNQAAVSLLLESIEVVSNLDPAILKNGNITKDSLINKINAALGMIESGNYVTAVGKLNNDIIKHTNGCAAAGEPDSDDWILTCEGQNQVYPLIAEAIEFLQNLI
ncbi:MAG: right-handed parallel beta-helix repeat-containing protein [Planctomycetota bacterium]